MHSVIEASPNFPKKVLIQPFIKEIKEVGEYSMIYICGDFSHCIHKIPGNGDFRVQHFYGGSYEMKEPDTNLRDAARKVFKNIPEDVLYARLDFIPYQGQYCLSEAELIEPWLHFTEKPDAADLLIHCLEYRYR
jgi:glutathione synthase/RimK-type ligase-like ATP-grasp enzyme